MKPTLKPKMAAALLTALAASTLVPTAASAHGRGELARDRQDIRAEQRDLARAYRWGSPARIRNERTDLRQARREYREDLRDRHNHRYAHRHCGH